MRRINVLLGVALTAAPSFAQNYPLENELTHRYLTEFTYDTIADLNVSYIMDYYNTATPYRKDQPAPVTLSWEPASGADEYRIVISENPALTDSIEYIQSKDSTVKTVFNLIPGRTYHYGIYACSTESGETLIKESEFSTTGMLRMIYAPGTHNVRDMGGWPGLGGHPIKYGQIYRGARLTKEKTGEVLITDEGKKAMRDLGIRCEIDLRSSSDVTSSVSALANKVNGEWDVEFYHYPKSVNARMYHYDANESNIQEVQTIINQLKKGNPVYYHCSMGADRTGTLGFLIGALLGMSAGDLAKDYELTTFCEPYTGEPGFARLRNYEGKKGAPDTSSDPKEYMFAPVIDKIQPGTGQSSLQRKIYAFFKNGVNGVKISEADLDWFIDYMVDYRIVKKVNIDKSRLTLKVGDTQQLSASFTPADATVQQVIWDTNDSSVATVSETGLVTAVGVGSTYVKAIVDDLQKTLKVTVQAGTDGIGLIGQDDDEGQAYNLAGYESDGEGLYIKDGKKYLSK